jgi:iron complex outermembrane recepter protein
MLTTIRPRWHKLTAYATLLASAAVLPVHNAALAQDTRSVSESELETVIVTAQRREERLQDVPIAISALSPDDLAQRGVKDLYSLTGAVPGLTISTSGGTIGGSVLSIRGISGLAVATGGGQATAVYLDGVYMSRTDAAFFTLDDVERIEVLRGPQGTLYGRNATAGAINIVTREPGDTLQGGVDVSYGNFDALLARGSISGPIGGGFSAGFSGSYERRDGYSENTVNGKSIDDREAQTVRAKLRYVSDNDKFSATLAADYSAVAGLTVFENAFPTRGLPFVGIGDPDKVTIDPQTTSFSGLDNKAKGAGLTLNYEVSDVLSFTAVSGWREFDSEDRYDIDGTNVAPNQQSNGIYDTSLFNEEVRALIAAERLRATVGANYFHESSTFTQATIIAGSGAPLAPFDKSKLDAYALFGQVEFDLIENLTLVGGVRYNKEERDFSIDYRMIGGLFQDGRVEDEIFIPSFGINYKLTPEILLYAKAGEGYQAPGFNATPGPTAPLDTFDAERLWAYELGIKSEFLDRRLTLNAAVFYDDYTDLQVRSITGVGLFVIDNAASATIQGAELEVAVRPLPGLALSGQVTYLDATYDEFCQGVASGTPRGNDPICSGSAAYADRAGNYLNQAPEWSGGVSIDYDIPIAAAGELNVHLDYNAESSIYYTTTNERAVGTSGWDKFGARVGFQIENGPEVYVYGRNLGDTRYVGYGGRATPTWVIHTISEPRTFGMGVRHRF